MGRASLYKTLLSNFPQGSGSLNFSLIPLIVAKPVFQREADFLERITSRRASTYSKFEDDYYGENIKNVSDYRQWLREQQKKQRIADKYDSKEESKDQVNTEAA